MTQHNFLATTKLLFDYYKLLGEKAIDQVKSEELLNWHSHENSNSMVQIVRHLSGNMISRWTDFLTSDGEKTWRNRDNEFEDLILTKEELLLCWSKGWDVFFTTYDNLKEEDLVKTIYIRNQGHSVQEAILRQLAHYSYHIGQLVYLAKLLVGEDFVSLSIPKNHSEAYNEKHQERKDDNFFAKDILQNK
ncbi:MAG: DUF1572 family protein [Saprospiraceae bacterium]|nr:DUF1572 family protein [Saprospiraceae bacterium]